MVKLREDLGLDVSLSVPTGNAMIYVHRLPGYSGNFENTLPGRKVPIHLSASGRCIMSLQIDKQVRQLINATNLTTVTPWSKTNPEEILEEISKCRELGFSVVKQEASAGTITLACPVTKGAEAIAGVSVHSPIAGQNESEFIATTLQSVVAVSRALSV